MLTLNKLITAIATYTTAHKQIKSWFFGDPWDELNGCQSIHYPMMFGTLQPNRISGTSDVTVIRFYICDEFTNSRLTPKFNSKFFIFL